MSKIRWLSQPFVVVRKNGVWCITRGEAVVAEFSTLQEARDCFADSQETGGGGHRLFCNDSSNCSIDEPWVGQTPEYEIASGHPDNVIPMSLPEQIL